VEELKKFSPSCRSSISKDAAVWDKTANNYFGGVVSPFDKGVQNPLFWYLDNKVPSSSSLSVIDIGCGVGNLLPTLADRFKHVVGVDFSPKMIELARKRVSNRDNVDLFVRDARDLSEFHAQFDVAIAINSVVLPTVKDTSQIIDQCFEVLKKSGIFLGIFPSMEQVLYRAMLVHESASSHVKKEDRAWKCAQEHLDIYSPDFLRGTVGYVDCRQKHFYLFELEHRLRKAGFVNVVIRKVRYPWEILEDPDVLHLKDYKGMWDWFVYARKP